jgi:excisionase family DNA binding protein
MDRAVLAITITEAAERLGISRSHAYELAAGGELPSLRLGRRILVPLHALEDLVKQASPSHHEPEEQPCSRGESSCCARVPVTSASATSTACA